MVMLFNLRHDLAIPITSLKKWIYIGLFQLFKAIEQYKFSMRLV
jgi:hypothetical protein